METMRKLLSVVVSLCSLVSFAVDPVAVWNGDLSAGSVKSEKYTMASDSSVVSFANGVASLAGLETGRAEIAAKPGLYYGLKRGDKLGNLSIQDKLTLAGADGKVTIEITKPEGATKHFYRIVCLPTPAEPAK